MRHDAEWLARVTLAIGVIIFLLGFVENRDALIIASAIIVAGATIATAINGQRTH